MSCFWSFMTKVVAVEMSAAHPAWSGWAAVHVFEHCGAADSRSAEHEDRTSSWFGSALMLSFHPSVSALLRESWCCSVPSSDFLTVFCRFWRRLIIHFGSDEISSVCFYLYQKGDSFTAWLLLLLFWWPPTDRWDQPSGLLRDTLCCWLCLLELWRLNQTSKSFCFCSVGVFVKFSSCLTSSLCFVLQRDPGCSVGPPS